MTPSRFHIPVLADVLHRPRLYRLLEDHGHCRIILLTGQAAQGKSTAAADYLSRRPDPSLWFHLTPAASDSGVLFDLISQGLSQFGADKDAGFPQTTLGTRQDLLRQAETLLTLMTGIDRPLNLVLDDLEALEEKSPALALLQALLEAGPSQIRFFLLSRSSPPLALSRFRVRRELFELTNEDLAFTLAETLAFFSHERGQGALSPKEAKRIQDITNGWAGGLVLLLEAARRPGEIARLPHRLTSEAFSYFSQEIYQSLPEETRSFLMQTALFEELDTRILTAFFKESDPVALLDRLEQRNLFIQKVLAHPRWPVYRYNNLFRKFLRTDLDRAMDRPAIEALNARIGQVYWEEKAHERAIFFFMAARAFDRVAQIIRIKGTDLVIKGRPDRLAEWINALPEGLIAADPWLIFFRTMAGRIKGGKENIKAFQHCLALFREKGETRGMLLSLAYLIEASVFIRQPSQATLKWIQKAEDAMAGLGGQYRFTWARTLLWQQIGLGYIVGVGDMSKGISACRNAILLAQGIGNSALLVNASVVLTLGLVQSGEFGKAREMLKKVKTLAHEDRHPEYRALMNITKIDLALKRGDTALAGDLLSRSEDDIDRFGLIFLYPGFVEARAIYHAGMGQFDQALQAAEHLSDFSILEGNDFYLGISHRIKAMVLLCQQHFDKAEKEAVLAMDELKRSRRGEIHLNLARQILGLALYSQGQIQAAHQVLLPALAYFRQLGSDLNFCETAFVLGMAALARKDSEGAASLFAQGLEKAVENRYRFFPLVPQTLLGQAMVLACLCLPDPEASLIPYVKTVENPTVLREVQAQMDKTMALWGKKEKRVYSERFQSLYRAACPTLRIQTLGPFAVTLDSQVIPLSAFGGARPLMLLKVIVLNRAREIPKEILIDAIWPEASEAAGEKSLKINLHRLRKALEPFVRKEFGHLYLSQRSGRVSLDQDLVEIDAVRFEALAAQGRKEENARNVEAALESYSAALALYRGSYFMDDPYLEGLSQPREMYRRTCLDLLGRKAAIQEDLGLWQDAIETWKKVLDIDSCHEAAYQNLMILLGEAGLKAEAAKMFTQCRAVLARELDTGPDERTLSIFRQVTGR